ncbi:MAG: hypothetical protein K6B65_06480 [Bacilli bacterium]|nr:hypothetical protein [Bacilli bacterium]
MSKEKGQQSKKTLKRMVNRKDLEKMTDEELLELFRKGIITARDILSVRYFQMRRSIWDTVFPQVALLLDEWETNECFFMAYLAAEAKFERAKDVKFLTYFCSVLKRQALDMLRNYYKERHFREAISLDTLLGNVEEGDGGMGYNELISGPLNEPVEYFNYNEILEELENVPLPDIDDWKETILLSIKGYGTSETLCAKGKNPRTIRRRVRLAKCHIKAWIKEQDDSIKEFEEENNDLPSDSDIDPDNN